MLVFKFSRSLFFGSYFLLTALLFFLSKSYLFEFTHNSMKGLIYYAVAFAVGVVGYRLSFREAPSAYRIVLRACTLLFTVYWATCYFSLPVEDPSLALLVNPLRWLVVLCGIIACFRPSFGILLFLYTFWMKKVIQHQVGLSISITDYTAVAEIGYFLALGLLVYLLLRRFVPQFANSESENKDWPMLYLFLYLTVTIHFSNYFFSGLQKIILAHSLTAWITDNHTEYLILTAKQYGVLPISKLLDVYPFMYNWVVQLTPTINAISLLSQVLAIVAIFRLRWMIALTILFDLFHVAIFLLSGIFFWKWVVLNLAIVLALRTFPRVRPPLPLVITGVVCMLVAPSLFFIAKLGWFETRSPVMAYMEAITDSHQSIPVPSNYFLMSSVTFAQNRIGRPIEGHFPTGGFGKTKDLNQMQQANRCLLTANAPSRISDEGFNRLEKFIRKHHRFILENADAKGYFNYDLYPHHIWSNPAEYASFNALDKRRIVGYRLVVESACLDFQGNQFLKAVKYRSAREFFL